MKVFLGDLVHTWEKVSLWTFPLNIGYVGGYAQSQFRGELELRLFKRPELMIEAIKDEKPHVVGLSHYVWNKNLNSVIFDVAKRHNHQTLTVGGGPIFTSGNCTEKGARKFFKNSASCDSYVFNQGERGFVELLRRFMESGLNPEKLRKSEVAGSIINDMDTDGCIRIGKPVDAIRYMDEIPSPYLSGLLDEFFDEPFVPILETNRSCPYRCTFCAWGIGTGKLTRFSDQRVLDEIEYISNRCTKTANLFVADANFSIFERDAIFAGEMYKHHLKNGYPGHVSVQWNKTRPDRVQRVARELKGITEAGASMQSINPDVLKAIGRKNLPMEAVTGLVDSLRAEGIKSTLFSELIVGLPQETKQSHIDANKKMVDMGTEIFNYNLHLLPGTAMDSEESRNKYFKRTGWRLHDNAFGIYDGVKVFEGQEVVIETTTMSMDELRSFRFIHFLIQFMWSRKWYYDFLHLFKQAGKHPVDMIVLIYDAFKTSPGEMGELYRRFTVDHDLENFASFEDLAQYWGRDENLERLRTGEYGKLNFQYTYDILLDHYEGFNEFLFQVSNDIAETMALSDKKVFLDKCREVLDFSAELRITLSDGFDSVVEKKRRNFTYNMLAWRESDYERELERGKDGDPVEHEFFLTERQRHVLDKQLSQFHSNNLNRTLRKMSEEISADEFFYQVRAI